MDVRRTKKFWDRSARSYDKSETQFEQIYVSMLQKTKQYIRQGDHILDFACGTGIQAMALAGDAGKITGIDISEKMIEIAREKAVREKIANIHFETLTLDDKSLEPQSFDVVLAFNILHLLENRRESLRTIHHLLKKDGLLLSATPCLKEKSAGYMYAYFFFARMMTKTGLLPISLKSFSSAELDQLLSSSGFEILDTEIFYDKISNVFVVAKKRNA